jgi:hypothetical protein
MIGSHKPTCLKHLHHAQKDKWIPTADLASRILAAITPYQGAYRQGLSD